MMAIAERWGDDVAREIAAQQFIGSAGMAAERVGAAMRIGADGTGASADLDVIAKLFQLDPAFHPRAYIDFHVERAENAVRCWIGNCDAFAEGDPYSWFALLAGDACHPALDATVRTVNPRASCRSIEIAGARVAWSVTIDAHAEPAAEAAAVGLVRLSKGATFRFVPRRPPRT